MALNEKHIGLVVAIEIKSVLEKYGNPIEIKKIDAYDVFTYKLHEDMFLHAVNCGPGEIASAAATQFCISKLNCSLIVNFGVVGGLTKDMSETKTCIVEKIIHYDYDTTAVHKDYAIGQYNGYKNAFIPATSNLFHEACEIDRSLKRVIVASGDKFIGDGVKKQELHNLFGADVCDMEAAGIALTCNRNHIPFLMIKCVSDGFESGEKEFFANLTKSADTCFEITDKIIKRIM